MHEDGEVSIESYADFNTCARDSQTFGDTRWLRFWGFSFKLPVDSEGIC